MVKSTCCIFGGQSLDFTNKLFLLKKNFLQFQYPNVESPQIAPETRLIWDLGKIYLPQSLEYWDCRPIYSSRPGSFHFYHLEFFPIYLFVLLFLLV